MYDIVYSSCLYNFKSVIFDLPISQVDKQKNDLVRELEDLKDKLEEEGGVKTAQVSTATLSKTINGRKCLKGIYVDH